MTVTSPSRAAWRRGMVVLAAGFLALAGVAPAIGGAPGPRPPDSATASHAADPWPASTTFPIPAPAIRGTDGLTPGGPGAPVPIEADVELPLPGSTRVAAAVAAELLPLGLLPLEGLVTRTLPTGTGALGTLPVGALAAGTAAAAAALAADAPLTVAPDGGRLPATCPASAWQVRPDPGGAGGRRSVVVSLASGAPDTCQGFRGAVPLVVTAGAAGTATAAGPPAPGSPVPGTTGSPTPAAAAAPARITARTAEPVAVAVLATPGISLRAERGRVSVLPIAPTSGPVPEGYAVEIRDRHADWIPVCATPDPADCAVPSDGDASERTYRVTAALGEWRRSSPAVAFPTPAG